jgi:NhaP-type Na+/H+ or K+/H+ antiporter
LVVGLTPGLTAGVLLGWLAGWLTRYRLLALTTLAFTILAITGILAGSDALVAYGSVPLFASVVVLERLTRRAS